MQPSAYPPNNTFTLDIRLLRAVNYALTRLYYRTRIVSPATLPARGKAIVVSNHTSGLDPLLLQSGCRRIIRWMMASEYYTLRPLKPLFVRLQAIAVHRNGRDSQAMRTALRALKNEQVLGIFPEGKIEMDDQVLPFHTGAAMLAFCTGAPIYPAYIDGTQRCQSMARSFLLPQQCSIAFGGPIAVPRRDPTPRDLDDLTERLHESVQQLREQSRRTPRL